MRKRISRGRSEHDFPSSQCVAAMNHSGDKGDLESFSERNGSSRLSSDAWLARVFLLWVVAFSSVTAAAGIAPSSVSFLPCPVRYITGIPCPGCGMTRACTALARGQIAEAFTHNPLAFGLIALAIGFAFAPDQIRRIWLRCPPKRRYEILGSCFVAVLACWITRLLG